MPPLIFNSDKKRVYNILSLGKESEAVNHVTAFHPPFFFAEEHSLLLLQTPAAGEQHTCV